MPEYEVGAIYKDAKGELYMRVYDPFPGSHSGIWPWMFLNPLASGALAEGRSEDFPHEPLTKLVPEKGDHDGTHHREGD